MAHAPQIKNSDRGKPLCYDPHRRKFILYEEILDGQEKIIHLEKLSPRELKKLVIERNRVGPDFALQSLTGRRYTRDDIIWEIEKGTDFGSMAMEAEITYLKDLLFQIEKSL
jgi:hypothetical protein